MAELFVVFGTLLAVIRGWQMFTMIVSGAIE